MSRQARLGLLVVAGMALFILVLFTVANRTFLFSDTYRVEARFNNVGGLEKGATIQYRGIDVGRVETIALPSVPNAPIQVGLALKEQARDLIREDTQAEIKNDGVVGSLIIVLSGGSEYSAVVEEGGTIYGSDPLSIGDLANNAMGSVTILDSLAVSLYRLMRNVEEGDGTLAKLIRQPNAYESVMSLSDRAGSAIDRLAVRSDTLALVALNATQRLQGLVTSIESGKGTAGRLLHDESLYEALVQTVERLDLMVSKLEPMLANAEATAEWSSVAAYKAAENMEALQHNVLFRRYFRNREDDSEEGDDRRAEVIERTLDRLESRTAMLTEWEDRLTSLEARLIKSGALNPDSARNKTGIPASNR